MKTQSKPKFTVEQYPLVFSFESSVQGTPVISVEMIYGEDPDKDLIIGLTVVYSNFVLAVIRGGVAGCVYSISCDVDDQVITTLVAVVPTLAEGFVDPEEPFTKLSTTPPYPGFYADDAVISFAPLGGELRTLVMQGVLAPDSVDITFGVLGGSIFEPPTPTIIDEIDLTFSAQSGIIYAAPAGDVIDDVTVNLTIVSGSIGPAPLGLIEDSVDIQFGPIGGSLGDP